MNNNDLAVLELDPELIKKYRHLKDYLLGLGSMAVAFSGGVDSTFLLYVASQLLGDKVVALTARSCSFPLREIKCAEEFCGANGIKHLVFDSEELNIEGFCSNPPNRCYLCKKELFGKIWQIAEGLSLSHVVEGSNVDDKGDYRPGRLAIAELGIKSPLLEAGLNKNEIRRLSQSLNLPTWEKQSFACLASRFPYGEEITEKRLNMIDKAEQVLLDLGVKQVRVRFHGNLARIECGEQDFTLFGKASCREEIYQAFKKIGFTYVTLDLLGYRTGSMNETLDKNYFDFE